MSPVMGRQATTRLHLRFAAPPVSQSLRGDGRGLAVVPVDRGQRAPGGGHSLRHCTSSPIAEEKREAPQVLSGRRRASLLPPPDPTIIAVDSTRRLASSLPSQSLTINNAATVNREDGARQRGTIRQRLTFSSGCVHRVSPPPLPLSARCLPCLASPATADGCNATSVTPMINPQAFDGDNGDNGDRQDASQSSLHTRSHPVMFFSHSAFSSVRSQSRQRFPIFARLRDAHSYRPEFRDLRPSCRLTPLAPSPDFEDEHAPTHPRTENSSTRAAPVDHHKQGPSPAPMSTLLLLWPVASGVRP